LSLYIYPGLIWLGVLISIPVFFIDLLRYKMMHRLIFSIIVMVAMLETYGTYSLINAINNLIFQNLIFTHLETLLLIFFFYLNFKKKKTKKVLLLCGILLAAWALMNSLFFQPITKIFQTYSLIPSAIVLILCCIHFFYLIIKDNQYQNENIVAIPSFWIVTAIMFFYSCSLLFFASIPLVNMDNLDLIYGIYNLIRALSVLMYLVMSLAFYAPLVFKN
jgi:hypothetical protein